MRPELMRAPAPEQSTEAFSEAEDFCKKFQEDKLQHAPF